jgi:hypothetical protein
MLMTIYQSDLPLPLELFESIAEFLAGDFQSGSLASLNVANRLIHEATSAVLWATVILDASSPQWHDMLKCVNVRRNKASDFAMNTVGMRKDSLSISLGNRRHVK